MLSRKKRILMAVLLLISLFALSSCTKKNDNANVDEAAISDSDFTESDKDLLTVDYKKFYDELSPHGEWMKVSAKELGINLKNGESAGGSSSLLNDLIGIRDARADAGFGFFFVWRPSPDLAISVSAGEPAVYVPYYQGRWVYTDYGWYFRAPTPYEEITCHYGRWAYDPVLGWVWIPGRVWAPAWVEWRDDDDYIAWAPLPPSVYIVNGVCPPVFISDSRYIVCERRYFTDPVVYRHYLLYDGFRDRVHINEMNRINGVMVDNSRIINRGPDFKNFRTFGGKNIEQVKINRVHNIKDAKFSGKEMNSYSPRFSRVKGKVKNENMVKPNKFVSFDHAKNRIKEQKNNHAGQVNDNKGKQNIHKGTKMEKNGRNKGNNENFTGGNRDNGFNKKENQRNNNGYEKFRKKSGTGDNKNNGYRKQNQKERNKGNYNNEKRKRNYDRGQQKKGNEKQGRQKQYRNGNQDLKSHEKQKNGSSNNNSGNDRKKQRYDNGSNNHGSHGRGKH